MTFTEPYLHGVLSGGHVELRNTQRTPAAQRSFLIESLFSSYVPSSLKIVLAASLPVAKAA